MAEPAREATARTFVAVAPDPEQRAALARVLERLAAPGDRPRGGDARAAGPRSDGATAPAPARVRWVRSEGVHVTLAFLGEVEAARLGDLERAVRRGAAGGAPFELTFGGIGTFGSPRRPRVIWLGVTSGVAALTSLAVRIRDALRSEGFRLDAAPFRPHLTLGRVRQPLPAADAAALASALDDQGGASTPAAVVHEVVVMTSRPAPGGSRYQTVARVALGAAEGDAA